MIDILKELGAAKRNQQIALKVMEHHKNAFIKTCITNKQEAEQHLQEYAFWAKQLHLTNRTIEQQHRILREFIHNQTTGQ